MMGVLAEECHSQSQRVPTLRVLVTGLSSSKTKSVTLRKSKEILKFKSIVPVSSTVLQRTEQT